MADTIFHFVEDLERILEILQEGFVPNFHIEDLSIPGGEELFRGIPMVSFSQFETDEKGLHRQQYGNYCIGLKLNWAIESGCINPVFYVSCPELLKTVHSDLMSYDISGYIKKYSSPWKGNPNYNNYKECEWRYVVNNSNVKWMLSKEEYDKWRGDDNKKRPKPTEELKKFVLTFEIDELSHLIVPTLEDKTKLVEEFKNLQSISGKRHRLTDTEIEYLESITYIKPTIND